MNNFIEILVQDKGDFCIDARKFYSKLSKDIKSDVFSQWINRRIKKYNFIESQDYMKFTEYVKRKNTNLKSKKSEYILTLSMAKKLCSLEKNKPHSSELFLFLNSIGDSKEIIIKEVPRLEHQFGDMLDKITGFKWDRQYPIDGGKYRLDFKLGTTLIVEYDEEQHENQKEKDLKRMEYCQKWILENEIKLEDYLSDYLIPFIRVKKGQELEGLHKIIMFLVGLEIIYSWNYEGHLSDII